MVVTRLPGALLLGLPSGCCNRAQIQSKITFIGSETTAAANQNCELVWWQTKITENQTP